MTKNYFVATEAALNDVNSEEKEPNQSPSPEDIVAAAHDDTPEMDVKHVSRELPPTEPTVHVKESPKPISELFLFCKFSIIIDIT